MILYPTFLTTVLYYTHKNYNNKILKQNKKYTQFPTLLLISIIHIPSCHFPLYRKNFCIFEYPIHHFVVPFLTSKSHSIYDILEIIISAFAWNFTTWKNNLIDILLSLNFHVISNLMLFCLKLYFVLVPWNKLPGKWLLDHTLFFV